LCIFVLRQVFTRPHWVTRVDPMTVVPRPLPTRELEACLIASGPMLVLPVTPAAFPRAASRITAIETILLATSVFKWCAVPRLIFMVRTDHCVVECSKVRLMVIGDVFAIPHRETCVDPVAVVVRPLPLRELEAC